MIKTKCVHSEIEPESDGLRLLVTRYRGRALPANRYDVWMPNLGPSERLLRGFLDDEITWGNFSKRYLQELMEDGVQDMANVTIKNHGQKFTLRLLQELGRRGSVTLLCHCGEDQMQCHRHLLQKKLQSKI